MNLHQTSTVTTDEEDDISVDTNLSASSESLKQASPTMTLSSTKTLQTNEQSKEKLPEKVFISSTSLPDPESQLFKRPLLLGRPTLSECKKVPNIDFKEFTSTLLSIESKGIDAKPLLEKIKVENTSWLNMPHCVPPQKSWIWDIFTEYKIWNIAENYVQEIVLQDVFLTMTGGKYSLDELGLILATSLKKNASDWIMGNLAGVYWRIKGDSRNAIKCFQLAYELGPDYTKDVPLIGLANIAHQLGNFELARIILQRAIGWDPTTVITHFTLGNVYAANDDWHYASRFFESTLGIQANFKLAAERLKSLQCQEVCQSSQNCKP